MNTKTPFLKKDDYLTKFYAGIIAVLIPTHPIVSRLIYPFPLPVSYQDTLTLEICRHSPEIAPVEAAKYVNEINRFLFTLCFVPAGISATTTSLMWKQLCKQTQLNDSSLSLSTYLGLAKDNAKVSSIRCATTNAGSAAKKTGLVIEDSIAAESEEAEGIYKAAMEHDVSHISLTAAVAGADAYISGLGNYRKMKAIAQTNRYSEFPFSPRFFTHLKAIHVGLGVRLPVSMAQASLFLNIKPTLDQHLQESGLSRLQRELFSTLLISFCFGLVKTPFDIVARNMLVQAAKSGESFDRSILEAATTALKQHGKKIFTTGLGLSVTQSAIVFGWLSSVPQIYDAMVANTDRPHLRS